MDIVEVISKLYDACEDGPWRKPTLQAAFAFVVEEVGEAQTMLRRMGLYGEYAQNNPRDANRQKFVNELADAVLMIAACAAVSDSNLMDAIVTKVYYLYYKWAQRHVDLGIELSTGARATFELEVKLLVQRMITDGVDISFLGDGKIDWTQDPTSSVIDHFAVQLSKHYPEHWELVNFKGILTERR